MDGILDERKGFGSVREAEAKAIFIVVAEKAFDEMRVRVFVLVGEVWGNPSCGRRKQGRVCCR